MALRLSAASGAAQPSQPNHATIGQRAGALLAAGEVKAYRALFAEAAEIENPHRRYKAQAKLLEVGLGAPVAETTVPALFLTIAGAAAEVLEQEPREPMLLNYLGVALFELGSFQAAEALFRAAGRLDPDLPHVKKNLAEITRRHRAGTAFLGPVLPRHIQAQLPALAKRAAAVAGRAHPAKGLTISLCMIVKDEEEMLPRSLGAIHDAVDEIVIVDTGSTDASVEIAESFGAKVLHHEWDGDFSAPRNLSFDAATGDWIIYLDADEVLVREDAEKLRALTGQVWREAFYLVETNFTGDLEDGTSVTHNALRVFRNRPEYRFEGRIHEQIAQTLPAYVPERLHLTNVRVEHYGYLGAVRDAKEKSRRNTELLERQLAEGGDSPFLHFNLGSEYAAAGDGEAALKNFQIAWNKMKDDPVLASYGFVPQLVDRLVTALRTTGDLAGARRQADEGLATFPDFTDLVLEQAYAVRDAGDLPEAIRLLERCLEMGDAPSRYSSTVGCGSYLALTALADIHRARGELAEAEAALTRCLAEFPHYLGAVLPLAGVMLARGTEPAAAAAQIEEQVEKVTPSVRLMLGTALYEAGHAADAEHQFRALLEAQASSDPARVALAESLLSQSRWAEAAAVAEQVPVESGVAGAAARSALFAQILEGNHDGYARALDRARAAKVAEADIVLLAGWQAALSGGELPASLPADATPLLVVTLEALLRVQEIDAFVALLPAIERVGLPWRDRRELLARMYMRRGFLSSAADEWISVCEQTGGDVEALMGLAQLAVAREMPGDALVFAREVQEIAPGHEGAGRILAALGS